MKLEGMHIDIPEGWGGVSNISEDCYAGWFETSEDAMRLVYRVIMPGILLLDIDLSVHQLPVFNPFGPRLCTINWCAEGRCEVDLANEGSLVVGSQTLCVASTAATSFLYPTRHYRGFELFFDLDQISPGAWTTLELLGLDEDSLAKTLRFGADGVVAQVSGELEEAVKGIEAELVRGDVRATVLAAKVLHLLALLAVTKLEGTSDAAIYLQRGQRDMAQAVHDHITASFSPSADLAPLVRKLGTSEATLRAYFAKVYGQSPAAFARERALAHAADLLSHTDDSVTDVARSCGYTNPSKFSAAFRRAYGCAPLEYRRRNRTQRIGERV